MCKVPTIVGAVVLAATAAFGQYTNIAWISFHPGDNQPTAAAAARGFTQAPDAGYTQLLANNGYSVTRFVTQDNPPQSLIDQLNTFDLIIISRSVNSAHYQQPNETLAWNSSITKPLMILGGYVLRESRLGYVTGNTIPDTTNAIRLQIEQPSHPIFQGIARDAQNVMLNPYADIVTLVVSGTNNVQRGISVVTDPLDGGGTILATVAPADAGPVGGTRMIIAEWSAGATLTPSDGGARNEVLGSRRMVFLTGSRESATVGTSEVAGVFDLIGDGPQLFLNAVAYMIPEPSSAALLLLGGLPVLLRRRR
ncbi:MAG: PEP-CTERM sorting domain-containing protein [Limisphaera sp.]|nr:PEP-CTERM sorting domain-containing protein [Limisphaera sp.]